MPCPPLVPISIIPPVSQGPSPILWQNGNQITRLNTPLNPSWLVYDGTTTSWRDGSAQAPIYLPNLLQVPSIQYVTGINSSGQFVISSTTPSAVTAVNLAGGTSGVVPFQSGVGLTSFTAVGTSGQILQSNGTSAPTWINSTSTNTLSAVVKRDASGNFSAGTVTASLSGNASTATTLQTARSISITGAAVASGVSFDGSANIALNTTITNLPDSSLATISTAGKVANSATTATNSNTANSIVSRDASGNFSAGTITASLTGNVNGNVTGNVTGNASTATTLQTARSISITGAAVASGVSFDGSSNIALNTTITSLPDSSLATISTAGKVANSATTATNSNTANSIVSRDASGNFSAGTVTASLSGNATSSSNLLGGTSYALPYQSGVNNTSFLSAGTNGQVLGILSGALAWVSSPAASSASNLAGGSAGVVPWQSAPSTTAFTAAGTTGQLLSSNGASTPTWLNQSAIAAGSATTATTATNIASGVAGAVPYQSGVGATAFTAAGTSGQVLKSNGTSAPSWITPTSTNTASAIVQRDASGNFSAGTITASLTGTASDVANGAVTPAKLSTGGPSWDTSGNVGIGTTSPVSDLEIKDGTRSLRIDANLSPTGNTYISASGSTDGLLIGTSDSKSVSCYTNNTLRLSVESTGTINAQANPIINVGYLGLSNTITFSSGTGSPEGNVTAPKGSIYTNITGATAITVLYVKTSGSGNTGWTAK
jgi:hypothetical protein